MDANELAWLVDDVVAAAEREFGGKADPALIADRARQAAVAVWRARPRVSDYVAVLALRDVREALAAPSVAGGDAGLRVGEAK